MEFENVLGAIGISVLAGLSTGIGGLIVLFLKKINGKILSIALGFSAGVMIYVSFVDILPVAKAHLTKSMGLKSGEWMVFMAFFLGLFLIAIIDKLVPENENPHVVRKIDAYDVGNSMHLLKTGKLAVLAITIHNFPEGVATFMSSINDIHLGIVIAVAVAIHNIPEGISVAMPVYYATGDKRKAFLQSLISGIAEPIGAIVGFLFLAPFINDTAFGIIYGAVAGIMVYISFDELLPTAEEYGEHHDAIFGLIAGMIVMGVSILLLM